VRRLYELDAIRGVAALVVFTHHWLTLNGFPAGLGIAASIAVDLFFVLSGFVMARTYEGRMRDGSISAARFIALRYRRLFFPMAFGSTIAFLTGIAANGVPTGEAITSYVLILAFLPTFWKVDAFALNLPAWSLFLEIAANAVHGTVLARLTTRVLASLLAVCAALAVVLLSAGYGRWDFGVLPILSCFPRELAFYLIGIIAFRTRGDASFRMRPNGIAAGLGALSYPLYAVHMPAMLFLRALGLSSMLWALWSVTLAAMMAISASSRTASRSENPQACGARPAHRPSDNFFIVS